MCGKRIGLVNRRDAVSTGDFHGLVQGLLQRFPMIQAVEWVPRIAFNERDAIGCQHSEAVLHDLIVLTAESIVPPPMHRLRLVRKVIKNAKLAA
jgi:hypothetical protein